MSTRELSSAVAYSQQNQPRFLDELKALLRIPSVSTLPEHKDDVRHAAEALATELKRIGLEHVELIEGDGHPLVYADWLHARASRRCFATGTTMCSRRSRWMSGSRRRLSRTERDGNIYARGAVDDKGQMWMHVKALESLLAAGGGKLPVNVRVIVEGEEEVGGEGIAAFVREHGES
jgi:acetylornithine deacetylase/succinyl-diaminopimelate desuccinylase-like protein